MYLYSIIMFIYLFLFFLLYLIGRYLFFSIKEEFESGMVDKVSAVLDGDEEEEEEEDEDDTYKEPSMVDVFAKLPLLQAQSLSQQEEIERLNEEVMELSGTQI
jgi:hypothetical protein